MDSASGTPEGKSHATYESHRIFSSMELPLPSEAGPVRRWTGCYPRLSLFGPG